MDTSLRCPPVLTGAHPLPEDADINAPEGNIVKCRSLYAAAYSGDNVARTRQICGTPPTLLRNELLLESHGRTTQEAVDMLGQGAVIESPIGAASSLSCSSGPPTKGQLLAGGPCPAMGVWRSC